MTYDKNTGKILLSSNDPKEFERDLLEHFEELDRKIEKERTKITSALSSCPKQITLLSNFPSWARTPKKLHKIAFGILLAIWLFWLGIASEGFSNVRLEGWVIIVAAPTVVYFALRFLINFLHRASRVARLIISANVLWIFLIATLGYIQHWGNELSPERFIALFILPPIGSWLALFLWKWSKSSK